MVGARPPGPYAPRRVITYAPVVIGSSVRPVRGKRSATGLSAPKGRRRKQPDTADGPAVVEPVGVGLLRITSGQLAVSDPGWGEDPRTVAVPQGGFPVMLSLLRTAYRVDVAAARVTFLDAPPREWEMLLSPDEDLGLLGEGQFYGVGVDTGTSAFMDATRTVTEDQLDEDLFIPLDSHSASNCPARSPSRTSSPSVQAGATGPVPSGSAAPMTDRAVASSASGSFPPTRSTPRSDPGRRAGHPPVRTRSYFSFSPCG
ncbi:DUF4241 domain-containing protein [Streptomyces bacillaris]|uniref:DUF4241 domain-containing protein n=1 Tax=Streptomyces bacillaris TaxID=68179 RepID=UPI003802FB1B